MADRNRYSRRGRYQGERDDRSWREQEEQFSNERGMQPDYEEGYGYQMSDIQQALDKETSFTRQLRLELATLSDPAVLEHTAIRELHMTRPGAGDTIVIERVV